MYRRSFLLWPPVNSTDWSFLTCQSRPPCRNATACTGRETSPGASPRGASCAGPCRRSEGCDETTPVQNSKSNVGAKRQQRYRATDDRKRRKGVRCNNMCVVDPCPNQTNEKLRTENQQQRNHPRFYAGRGNHVWVYASSLTSPQCRHANPTTISRTPISPPGKNPNPST